jgi:hypothetical protein
MTRKNIIAIVILIVLIVGIVIGVILVRRPQTITPKADTTPEELPLLSPPPGAPENLAPPSF